jgi:ABC-type transport system substrate-binding protein
MKPTLMKTALATALLLAPVPAFAQAAAAGAVPNAFDRPAQTGAAQARPAPTPAPATAAQAPDIARSEETLRAVIAAAQGTGFDYSAFTTNLGTQIRQQEAQVIPLIKGFGAIKTVEYVRQEGEAQLFKVTFDNQVTEWLIGFDADDKIAALLFRPAED